MAAFRAVEGGFTLIRPASNGISTVADRYGCILQRSDYFAGARIISVDVPRHGSPTLYARVGDLAAWLIVALLAVLLVRAAFMSRA